MKRKILAVTLCVAMLMVYMPFVSNAEDDVSKSFKSLDVGSDEISIEVDDDNLVYDGGQQTPSVTFKYKDKDKGEWITVDPGNYTISYSNNINAGTAAEVTLTSNPGVGEVENLVIFTNSKAENSEKSDQITVNFEIQKRPVYADEIFKVNDSSLYKNAMDLIESDPDYKEIYESAKVSVERNILQINKEYDGVTVSAFDTVYAAFMCENPDYIEESDAVESKYKYSADLVEIKGTSVYNTTAAGKTKVTFTPDSVAGENSRNYRIATAEEHQAAERSMTTELEASISKNTVTVKPDNVTTVVGTTPSITFSVDAGTYQDEAFTAWITGLSASDITVTDIAGVEISFEEAVKTVGTYTIRYKKPDDESTLPANYEITEGSGRLIVSGSTVIETPDKNTMGFVAEVDGSGKASISSFDTDRLSEIGAEGDIAYAEIDLTTLGKNVGYASVAWNTMQDFFKEIEENPFVMGCVFTTSSGSLQLDAQSLGKIIGQAQSSGGANIEIGFKALSASDFTSGQNKALNDYSVLKRYDIFAGCGGKSVTDLGGGYATVTIPYTVPKGVYTYKYKVFKVGEDGSLTDVYAYYDEELSAFTFMTQELSKYVLTYEKCDGTFLCPSYYLKDVSVGDWFHEDVDFALTTGMMNGTSDEYFSPNTGITRGMLVTILWRLQNKPSAGSASFIDVNKTAYYSEPVAWAASCGIVTGYNASQFGPEDKITREQFAAILYRYAAYLGKSTEISGSLSGYTDAAEISSYAKDSMTWANTMGYITGTSATKLNPKGNTTRAQAAAILHRFLEG